MMKLDHDWDEKPRPKRTHGELMAVCRRCGARRYYGMANSVRADDGNCVLRSAEETPTYDIADPIEIGA